MALNVTVCIPGVDAVMRRVKVFTPEADCTGVPSIRSDKLPSMEVAPSNGKVLPKGTVKAGEAG